MGLPLIPPLRCWECKRYRGLVAGAPLAEGLEAETRPACDAFPSGIPADIAEGRFDHINPHEGDHGIRFEPVDIEPLDS
jgi:hypothetical protein